MLKVDSKQIFYFNNIFSNIWLNFSNSKIEIKIKPYIKTLPATKIIDFQSPWVLYKNETTGQLTRVDPSLIQLSSDGTSMTINDDSLVGKILYGNIPEIVIDPNNANINVEYLNFQFDKIDGSEYLILTSDNYNINLASVNYQLTMYPNTELKYNINTSIGEFLRIDFNNFSCENPIFYTSDDFFTFFENILTSDRVPFNIQTDFTGVSSTPFFRNSIIDFTFETNDSLGLFDFQNSCIEVDNAVDFSSLSVTAGPFLLNWDANLYGTISNLKITANNINVAAYFANMKNYYGDPTKDLVFYNCEFDLKNSTAIYFAYLNGSNMLFDNCVFYLNKDFADSIKTNNYLNVYRNRGNLIIKANCLLYDENNNPIPLTNNIIAPSLIL